MVNLLYYHNYRSTFRQLVIVCSCFARMMTLLQYSNILMLNIHAPPVEWWFCHTNFRKSERACCQPFQVCIKMHFNEVCEHKSQWIDSIGWQIIVSIKQEKIEDTRPRGSTMRPRATFPFLFFYNCFILHSPSSSSLLFLAPPSSRPLLPSRSSFFLVQHCLNHFGSIKGHFSSILTKA